MKLILVTVSATLSFVAGCAPLSQAPLVYSSAVQVGLKVAAATPTNPGVQLNIGYDQIDTAYVPVVAGRPCRLEDNATCEGDEFRLVTIQGVNNRGSSESTNASALADARTAVDSATTAVRDLERQLNDTRQRNNERNEEIAALSATEAAPAETTPDGDAAPSMPPADRIAALRAEISSDETGIAQLDTQLTTGRAQLTAAVANLEKLQELVNHSRANDMTDALSVYGSFNSTASANASTPTAGTTGAVGLNLGKTFSTGVASQHLTQGIADSARANAMAQCLQQAQQVAATQPEASRPALILSLSQRCGAAEAMN